MTIQPKAPFMIEFLGTPEAGKTSLIHRLKDELSKSLSVGIIQESAEIVPSIFPKGSMEANLWMRYNTLNNLLKAKFSTDFDVILIDRGIIDSVLWNYYYYSTKMTSQEVFDATNSLLANTYISNPDQVYYLTTTPEESVKRRGGPGRIVTYEFVKTFNEVVDEFMQHYSHPFFKLDTTDLSKDEKFAIVYEHISTELHLL